MVFKLFRLIKKTCVFYFDVFKIKHENADFNVLKLMQIKYLLLCNKFCFDLGKSVRNYLMTYFQYFTTIY
jgi:hypothetical protein